jgi:uncharacterized Zn-finger protein
MALHWSFGHLQPKLWAKEGPGVKLAVWLPTTKSQESTCSQCALRECDMVLESSLWGATTLVHTLSWSKVRARSYEVPKTRVSDPGLQPGKVESWKKSDIRAWVPRRVTEYTIGSKVVAYSRVWAVVSLVCPSARGKSQHPRVSRMLN